MKTLLSFCFVLLISFHTVHAQTDFRKGYIVREKTDSTYGLIQYREGPSVHRSCLFKSSETSEIVEYGPDAIVAYGFPGNKHYESKPSPDDADNMLFAEAIVKGFVSLFRLEGKFTIERGDEGLHILTNETTVSTLNGKRVSKQSNQHIATLNMLLFDCIEIRERISRIQISEKNLTKLVQDYNQCKGGGSTVLKSQKPWLALKGALFGGVNMSSIDFRENNPDLEYLYGKFDRSISPAGGISLDFSSPRTSERLSFHIDMFYTQSSYSKYSKISTSFLTETDHVTIDLKELKLPFGLRYTLSRRVVSPFFNFGVAPTFHLSSNSLWVHEVDGNGQFLTSEDYALNIQKTQLGFWCGLGTMVGMTSELSGFIELRYERTNGIGGPPGGRIGSQVVSQVSNFQIFLGLIRR